MPQLHVHVSNSRSHQNIAAALFPTRYANVTAGGTCVVENTGYTGYGASGEFIDIVSR